MIGCLADFGSKPVALLADPLIDSLTGDLSNKPSDSVSSLSESFVAWSYFRL